MRLWLALDPETRRVTAQPREFDDHSFPRGLRGIGWPQRQTEVDADVWTELLTGRMSNAEVDRLHREWWDQARTNPDEALWPEVP